MCFRLLGNFVEAAKDLRLACKIDFDEQADEWLKEVTPNVSQILERIGVFLFRSTFFFGVFQTQFTLFGATLLTE